jgi:hypothetical protein
MSVVTADRAAVGVEQLEQSGRETWLLGVRCGLFGAVVLGATAFAAPRVALVRHGQGVVVLAVLLAITLAVRSWRGFAAEPRANPMRAADLSIAGGLGCAAAFLGWQLPAAFGPDAAAWGAGLGVMAPLVGAAIAVLFGSRMLYRLRGAVTALALLSPALLRPAYVLLDTATKYAARAVVEIAVSIDSSLLAPGGSTAAAGDLLAQRLTKAGALEAIAVMVLLGWRMTTGGRFSRTAWSLLVVVVCLASALRDAVPAACVAAALAAPAFRLRIPALERQPRPLRCLPHGEPALLAATAVAFVGIGVALTQSTPATRSPRVAFPDAVETLPGAAPGAADPREVALAGANAYWQHWTLPARPVGAPSSASLTVDYVTTTNGFDGDTLAAALRAGGYRLLSTRQVSVGSAPAVLRSFAGSAGDGMTSISWTPDGVPGHLAVVISYEPDGVTAADAAAATAVAARLAAASATP